MRRWEDVRMWRCEDERMWRRENVKMRGCEDEKIWRWEDAWQTPLLEEPCAQTLSGKKFLMRKNWGPASTALALWQCTCVTCLSWIFFCQPPHVQPWNIYHINVYVHIHTHAGFMQYVAGKYVFNSVCLHKQTENNISKTKKGQKQTMKNRLLLKLFSGLCSHTFGL